MKSFEHIAEDLTYEELHYTLASILDHDYTVDDFLSNLLAEELLYTLVSYDIIYVTSNNRVLLTPSGEKLLQHLNSNVDLIKNHSKLYKAKL